MKRLQSILFASLLTLSICSSAFAGLMPGGKTTQAVDRQSAGLMPGGIVTTVALGIVLP